jgi:hypothetical protein
MRIWSITKPSAARHASLNRSAQVFSNAISRAALLAGRSSEASSASSGPSAPGWTTSMAMKLGPISGSRSAMSTVSTAPSAPFMTNSRSMTRIVPVCTNSSTAEAI